jgi:hypothetical protein
LRFHPLGLPTNCLPRQPMGSPSSLSLFSIDSCLPPLSNVSLRLLTVYQPLPSVSSIDSCLPPLSNVSPSSIKCFPPSSNSLSASTICFFYRQLSPSSIKCFPNCLSPSTICLPVSKHCLFLSLYKIPTVSTPVPTGPFSINVCLPLYTNCL